MGLGPLHPFSGVAVTFVAVVPVPVQQLTSPRAVQSKSVSFTGSA
jgi:hypothetical protein